MSPSQIGRTPPNALNLLQTVVDNIGTAKFTAQLLRYLDHVLGGIDHCALYLLDGSAPSKLGGASLAGPNDCERAMDIYLSDHWQSDPLMWRMRDRPFPERPNMIRMDVDLLAPSGLRDLIFRKINVKERVMLSGSGAAHHVGCSILRSDHREPMPEAQLEAFVGLSPIVLSAVAKHTELTALGDNMIHALTSVSKIAAVISHSPEGLSPREIEVCARTLSGMSAFAIGMDLKIAEESVRTYRKRAYHRLGIASGRELLVWYLGSCSDQQAFLPRPHQAVERPTQADAMRPHMSLVGWGGDPGDNAHLPDAQSQFGGV